MVEALVPQKDREVTSGSILFLPLASLMIYSMVIPIMLLDIWTQLYQLIYFSVQSIPKLPRKEYVVVDRLQLKKLNLLQKINCIYCGYANGVLAWVKAVANQTEIYSCAIKHRTAVVGQDHQSEFYDYNDFE